MTRRIHTRIETEQKGNLVFLLGHYPDIYGKDQTELLRVNPSKPLIADCKSMLANGPTDLKIGIMFGE